MGVTANVRALLNICEKKQGDLLPLLGVNSKQSLSNKFTNERWSADDLIKVAGLCGCKLAFVMPNGQQLFFDAEKEEAPSE